MKYLNDIDFKDCVGKVFTTKSGHKFKIIEYNHSKDVLIEFTDSGFKKTCQMKEVRTGAIKDTSVPSLYGNGIVGSKYRTKLLNDSGRYTEVLEYACWSGMIERCYSKARIDKRPTYDGCSTSDNFKHYEYFYEWCQSQVGFKKGWCLDKDILIKGNKLYSEDTCVFVPNVINVALCKSDKIRGKYPIGVHWDSVKNKFISQVNTGKGVQDYLGAFDDPNEAFYAYKQAKESYLKVLAEKWKGEVDERVYYALLNYQVDIND